MLSTHQTSARGITAEKVTYPTLTAIHQGECRLGECGMEIEEDKMSHCETCTCGLTYIYWSDRESHVDLTSPGKVAEAVMSCALDHSYDRTGTGIPYGFPDGLADALTPIVAKHLSAVEPDWEHKSVYMDDHNWSEKGTPQRDAFKKELIEAVEAYYTK